MSTTDADQRSHPPLTGPLVGVRVLDLGQLLAGPLVGTILGDWGADVVKVEQPTVGDPTRRMGPIKDGVSLWWKANGRNKRAIELDLRVREGQDVVRSLVPAADIVSDVCGRGESDPRLTVATSAYEACQGAHAVAIVTEWDEFKSLDYARIQSGMMKPAFLFDGRNIVNLPKLRELGFKAFGIGK